MQFIRLISVISLLFATYVVSLQATDFMKLDHVGSYNTGIYDESTAEIPAYSSIMQRLYVTNSAEHSVMILDMSDPENITKVTDIALGAWGSPNSVAVYGNYVAVAVEATIKTNSGNVIVFDLNGNFLKSIPVGALPDMLTFTHDGMKILVCNEGEPNNSYTIDPEGSVSIIDLTNGLANATVATASFTQFNGSEGYLRSLGIRIFGPNASAAQDFEPEYLTIAPDNMYAYVVLQENNAMATIHIPTATVTSVKPLGYKNHMLPGNGLDASDRDNIINIANWPVKGMYQPDGITSYTVNGNFYLVTANEGDARDYDGYSEESRAKDLDLDPIAFPDAAFLQNNSNLGRLNVTTTNGDIDGDGLFEELYAFGTRSFTIWDAQMNVVFDSGDLFEQIIKSMAPAFFNVSNSDKNFDSRSDNKGPEPEDVEIVNIRDEYYAFVLLERQGGIMVFNISDPHNPKFVTWENNRDYNAPFPSNPTPAQLLAIGDLGPEGIVHIPAAVSPNGYDMFAVTNEVSGTVSLFKVILTPVVNLENTSACKRVAVSLGTDGGDNTVLWGSGDYTYTWSPSSGLDLSDPANPIWLSPVFSKNFNLTVLDNVTGYTAHGSIYVTVNEGPSFNAPNLYSHPKNMPLDLTDLLTDISGTNPISYVWNDDNGIINDPTYVIPPVGLKKYYVQATDGESCESMQKRIMTYVNPKFDMPPTKNHADNVPDVGLNGNLVVFSYPNPVVNEFNLDIEMFEKSDVTLKIMDISGKILSETILNGDSIKSQINIEHFSAGVYIMSIETENDYAIRKIIKQ